MTRKVCTVLGMVFMGLVLALPVAAEEMYVTANIPFEFSVNRTILPAGEYEFQVDSGSPVLLVRSLDTHAAAFSQGVPADVRQAGSGEITFHRYGDRYFLSSVANGQRAAMTSLPMSKTERELARTASAQKHEVPLVLASR